MAYKEEMLLFNRKFVENREYERFITTKFPERKVAILTCMDARLSELLPAALNLKNGDAKIIKNAGGVITHPFGSVMRSLLVCIYELDVKEIFVIGHNDCGMQNIDPNSMTEKMLIRGVTTEDLELIKYFNVNMNEWLKGFHDPAESVRETMEIISRHPLVPKDVVCSGFLMDPMTGGLEVVEMNR
jgi:carbonic anhydrase